MRNAFIGMVFGALLVLPLTAFTANDGVYRQLDLFGDVFQRIHADYVNDVEDADLIEAAINGMLQSLDPHSSYLNPDNFREMQVQTRGEFGGLGIEVTMEQGVVKVVTPIDDTPAYRAGIKAGDYITHLDGAPIRGMTLDEAVKEMRGPKGSDLTVTVARKGKKAPFDIVITRAIITVKSVRARKEENVIYVRITTFNEQTEQELKRVIKLHRKALGVNFQGLVLDLRNNPGGLLDQAVAVSDAFLNDGAIVSTRGRDNRDSQRYSAREGDLVDGAPIIVLINGGSASASEIVAGALQDHRRAPILGTKSFGKGSVQTIIPLAGGTDGALKLTTAKYYTPSGESIQAKGISPDFSVEQYDPDGDRPTFTSEADLRNHLDAENEAGTKEDDAKKAEEVKIPGLEALPKDKVVPKDLLALEQAPDDSIEDYQLARALEILRGIPLQTAAN